MAWILGAIVLVLLGLNGRATLLVLRDTLSERGQKTAQLLLIWLLPLIGALLVSTVHKPRPAATQLGDHPDTPGYDDLLPFDDSSAYADHGLSAGDSD